MKFRLNFKIFLFSKKNLNIFYEQPPLNILQNKFKLWSHKNAFQTDLSTDVEQQKNILQLVFPVNIFEESQKCKSNKQNINKNPIIDVNAIFDNIFINWFVYKNQWTFD